MKNVVYIVLCCFLFSCADERGNIQTIENVVVEDTTNIETVDSSLVLSNHLRQENPEKETSFLTFYKKFTGAIAEKNYQEFNNCIHSDYGVYIISSAGGMPKMYKYYDISNYKSEFLTPFLDLDFTVINTVPVFEQLPNVICDEEIYDNQGCFAQEVNQLAKSQIWNYTDLNDKQKQEVEVIAKTITYTVVNTPNYIFYLSLIEEVWYVTFIDIRIPCSA
jgi:hypothetical protein